MAIGKTIQIHDTNGLRAVDDYTTDKDKTTFSPEMQRAFEYDTNPYKTTIPGTSIRLVSGYQCNPDMMQDEFAGPRDAYNVTHDPINLMEGKQEIFGIHYIMSFPDVEGLDPRLVHQIGLEFCERMKEEGIGNFQCVVSTHMNTQHLHNHILINAFDIEGKRKFHDNMTTRHKMWEINDELCIKYGLPIIKENEKSKTRSEKISENKARLEGRSWKEQIRADIDAVINTASTYEEFQEQMKDIGYEFRTKTDGTPISIWDEEGHKVRLSKLGDEYTYESILQKLNIENYRFSKTPTSDFAEVISDSERGNSQRATSFTSEPRIPNSELLADEYTINPLEPKSTQVKVYMKKISRYTENGRRRSDLEMLFLKIREWLRLAIQVLQDRHKNSEIEVAKKQQQHIDKAVNLLQKYEISNVSTLNKKMKDNGRQKRAVENDIDAFTGYIEKIKLNEIKSEKTSDVIPMTKSQRQQLYLLLKSNPDIHIKYKFDDIDAIEAEKTINYLLDNTKAVSSIISGTYTGKTDNIENVSESQTRETTTKVGGLPSLKEEELQNILENKNKELNKLKSEYKDFKFIQKNVTFCKSVEKDINNNIDEDVIINKNSDFMEENIQAKERNIDRSEI